MYRFWILIEILTYFHIYFTKIKTQKYEQKNLYVVFREHKKTIRK